MHTAQFNKRNVLCEMTATCVTVGMVRRTLSTILPFFFCILTALMQKDAPSANGSPNTIILQGQWESAIVKDESTWALEDGKLVLDIRKRVEGEWKVRRSCSTRTIFLILGRFSFAAASMAMILSSTRSVVSS
jgi:hypothetical protein